MHIDLILIFVFRFDQIRTSAIQTSFAVIPVVQLAVDRCPVHHPRKPRAEVPTPSQTTTSCARILEISRSRASRNPSQELQNTTRFVEMWIGKVVFRTNRPFVPTQQNLDWVHTREGPRLFPGSKRQRSWPSSPLACEPDLGPLARPPRTWPSGPMSTAWGPRTTQRTALSEPLTMSETGSRTPSSGSATNTSSSTALIAKLRYCGGHLLRRGLLRGGRQG